MSKAKHKPTASNQPPKGWWAGAAVAMVVAIAIVASINFGGKPPTARPTPQTDLTAVGSSNVAKTTNPPATAVTNADSGAMEANQSLVVTHDLDFGSSRPTLAEAMAQIERHSRAEDGTGRTFAILEAFNGEFQPDGKMRVSLRISTEKPGLAQITFRRNGQELWKSRIKPATHKTGFAPGQLTILFYDDSDKSFMVDGSTGPATIFEAILKESAMPVGQAWPDGTERKLKFIYSACGCPIEVLCRRVGARTERTKTAAQVIFPDDPEALQTISRLMVW